MSILSDAQIEALCIAPTKVLEYPKDPNQTVGESDGMGTRTLIYYDPTPRERETTEEERAAFRPMITPFNPELVRYVSALDVYNPVLDKYPPPQGVRLHQHMPERKIISKGLTSYGYDVSLAVDEVKVFTNINSREIDPKNLDEKCLVDAEIRTAEDGSRYFLLPPHSYALAYTVEYFKMPRDVIAVCLGKSTYARAGIQINATPIEPGWEGNVVIEIFNSTNLPSRVYLEEGISQFLFFQGKSCRTSYGDRGGKYMGQTGVTLPKV